MHALVHLPGAIVMAMTAVASCGTSGGSSNVDTSDTKHADAPAASKIPRSRTAPADLDFEGTRHTEVLRIDQDFHPNDDYEIALDAWVETGDPDTLLETRMWWMDTSKNDERSVFGKGVRRHIDIDYERRSERAWAVAINRGNSRFIFDIELGQDGAIEAFGDVDTDDGGRTPRCHITTSTLVAKKILGLPVGLDRLDVTCTDPDGTEHSGRLHATQN